MLFIYLVAVIVWLGGLLAIAVIGGALAARRDHAGFTAMLRGSDVYGRFVVGPAAGVTLLAGFALAGKTHLGLPLWVAWGLVSLVASMALGGTLIRRAAMEIARASASTGDASRLLAAERRFLLLDAVNLAILFSAVAAMVFKPML